MSRLLPLFRPGGAPTGVGLRRRPVVAGDPPAAVALAWPLEADPATWAAGETYVSRHYAHRSATLATTATGATSVQFWLDGAGSGTLLGTATDAGGGAFALGWDCSGIADGPHSVTARAVSSGGTLDSDPQPVMVWNGPEAPPDLSGVAVEASGPIYLDATGPEDAAGNPASTPGLLSFDAGTKTHTLLRDAVFPGVAFVLRGTGTVLDLGGFALGFNADGLAGEGAANASSNTRCGIYVDQGFQSAQGTYLGITEATAGNKCEVRNGTIAQAAPNLLGQSAIFAADLKALSARDLKAFTSGVDACCVRSSYSYQGDGTRSTIERCRLLSWCPNTSNRHAGPGVIWIANEAATVQDNVLLGGHCGWTLGPGASRTGATIARRNVASNLNPDTNGYAQRYFQAHDVTASDNVCIGVNARGVLIDGDYSGPGNVVDNVIAGNVILAWEHPNKEYGANLSTSCLRLRYKVSDFTATGNHCLGVCGPAVDGLARADGTHPYNDTCYPPSEGGVGSNVLIDGNTFDAVLAGSSAIGAHLPIAASFNGRQDGAACTFTGNICRSNAYPLGVSGGEADSDLRGSTLDRNTLGFADGATLVGEFLDAVDSKLIAIGLSADPWAAWARSLAGVVLGGDVSDSPLASDRATLFALTTSGSILKTDMYMDLLRPTFTGGAALSSASDVHVRAPYMAYAITVRVDADGDGAIGAGDHEFVRSGGTSGGIIRQEIGA